MPANEPAINGRILAVINGSLSALTNTDKLIVFFVPGIVHKLFDECALICYHKTMFNKIKNRVEKEIAIFIKTVNKTYRLNKISPVLFENIKDFISRKGKRIRPILFIIGYLGFANREKPGLYTSALAIELLHDFMLVHDDIIDKSHLRRGLPSIHANLNSYLRNYGKLKFNGQDLAIVVGDVMYAIAIDAFLAIKENMERKEEALRRFIQAAVYTGCGEFIELLNGVKRLENVTKNDIYKIYDYKTAFYTFSTPLATGAILAGANSRQTKMLYEYGIYLGRAFQIKDDVLGIFADESKSGKSSLTDLQEGKKTFLIWHAYKNSDKKTKLLMKKILLKKKINKKDLILTRQIIRSSQALKEAKREIAHLVKKAKQAMSSSRLSSEYKKLLLEYPDKILTL